MRDRTTFPILLLCWACPATAQHWAAKCSGLGNERVTDVRSGPGDVVFAIGEFGPGSQVAGQAMVGQGLSDIFVMKQTGAGGVQWIQQAGGAGLDIPGTLCPGPDGSVVVCGQFTGTANIFGTTVSAQGGGMDLFVAKLSGTDGTVQWVRTGGSPAYADRAADVAVGPDGRVVVTGEFRGTGVFDAGTFTSTIDPGTSLPGSDVFVMSYAPDGSAEWFRQGVADRDDQAAGIAIDPDGNAYAYGTYSETISFGTPHPNAALNQIYLVKFDPGGGEQWFRRIGGAAMQRPADLRVGDTGGLFLCGDVQGALTFYDDPPTTVPSAQPSAYFVLRSSFDGTFESGTTVGSVNDVSCAGLDQRGSTVAVYGSFVCAFGDLAAHYNATGIFIATGEEDLFIARHHADDLELTEAQQFGGHQEKRAGGITSLAGGDLIFCGAFSELLIFPAEGDGWGEDFGTCPPFAGGSPSYCGDDHYTDYEAIGSTGALDGFIARGYVDGREPYDPYVRYGNACDRSATEPVVFSQPGVISDDVLVCGGDTLTWNHHIHRPGCPSCACSPDLTVSWDVASVWSTGGSVFDSIHVWTSGWYWLEQTSTNGCYTAVDSIHVTVLPQPQAWVSMDGGPPFAGGIGPNTISYCAPVTLLAADLLPGETFQWYVDGSPVAGPLIEAEAGGQYLLEVTSSNGCSNSNWIQFELLDSLALPNITAAEFQFLYQGVPLDVQDTLQACAQGTCFIGELVPTWYVDGTPTVLSQPIFVYYGTDNGCGFVSTYPNLGMAWNQYPSTTGWYPLHVHIVMGVEGCTEDSLVFDAYDSVYIETGIAPVIQPLEDLTLCLGDTAVVVLDCAGCGQVEWSGPGVIITSPGQDTAWVSAFGLYSVIATNTGDVPCVDVEYFTVEQAAPPPLLIEPFAICPGDSALLFTTFNSVTYDWFGPGGDIAVDDDSIYVSEVGSYYLTVLTDQGCELFAGPVILQEFATPELSVFPDDVLCPGESAVLQVLGGGLTGVVWDPPLSGNDPFQSVEVSGVYSCTVTACGESFALSATITASTIEVDLPSGPFTICGGGSLLLEGPSGDYAYLWTPGNSTGEDLLVTSGGTYQLQLTDSLGCSALSNAAVVVEQQFTEPLQVTGDSICAGDSSLLLASGSGVLQWYADAGLSMLLATGGSYAITGQSMTDTLYVTQTEAGCTGAMSAVLVVVTPVPGPVTITGDASLCEGDTLLLNVVDTGAYQFTWITPGGEVAGPELLVPSVGFGDAGEYLCQASDAGCTGTTDGILVTVQAAVAPPVIAGGTGWCVGDIIELTVSGVEPGAFTWNAPDGQPVGSSLNYSLLADAGSAGVYTVVVSGGDCPDVQASLELIVEDCDLLIPNVFTPNSDGRNDVFVVEGSLSSVLTCSIYNRWGQRVWSGSGNRIAWDGLDDGRNVLPDGVYYYEIQENRAGHPRTRSGYVQLLRGR